MLLLAKPFVYFIILLAGARWLSPGALRVARAAGAAAVRIVVGLVVGIPVGLAMTAVGLEGPAELLVLFPVRLLLWFLVVRAFHRDAPPTALWSFCVAAAVVSTGLELLSSEGVGYVHWLARFHMC